MFLGLVGFSLIEAPKKIRAGCFYLACLMFLIILIADHSKNSVVLWLSIVAFAIGCIVNVKEWKVSNSMMIGGGFSDGILPYPKKQDYYDSQRDQQRQPSDVRGNQQGRQSDVRGNQQRYVRIKRTPYNERNSAYGNWIRTIKTPGKNSSLASKKVLDRQHHDSISYH